MQEWKQRLEVATNVAIMLVCVLITVIGVKQFCLPAPTGSMSGPTKGSHIPIAGLNWSRAERTLILALSTHCHFCGDSAEFYRKLLPQAKAQHVQIVAVFPEPTEESRRYLADLALSLSDVAIKQAPVSAVLARGTPTVIIADSGGSVINSWAGKLAARGEAEVLKAVH